MTAIVENAPEIVITPDGIEEFIMLGDIVARTITVENQGDALLRFETDIDLTGEPERDNNSRTLRTTNGSNSPRRDDAGELLAGAAEIRRRGRSRAAPGGTDRFALAFAADRTDDNGPAVGEPARLTQQLYPPPRTVRGDGKRKDRRTPLPPPVNGNEQRLPHRSTRRSNNPTHRNGTLRVGLGGDGWQTCTRNRLGCFDVAEFEKIVVTFFLCC